MIYLHCPILIKKNERARLVQMRGGKRNPKLDRRDRDSVFAMRILRIPFLDLFPAPRKIAFLGQLLPNPLEPIVLDLLAIRGGVRFAASAIQIFRAHNFRRQPKLARNAVDDFLDRQHSLRSAESAKRRVRCKICFRDESFELNVRKVIAVIEMKESAVRHRAREIKRPAAIRIDVDLGSAEQTLAIVTDTKLRQEWMSLSGNHHVLVAIETDPDFSCRF